MPRDIITRHEGAPYPGRRGSEERRDVFSAELDAGASVVNEDASPDNPLRFVQPVYTIIGSGEQRRDAFDPGSDDWKWGVGTNLRVSRSSIPALMRVLADLLEQEAEPLA